MVPADVELLFEVLAAVLDAAEVIEVDFDVLIGCVNLLDLVLDVLALVDPIELVLAVVGGLGWCGP